MTATIRSEVALPDLPSASGIEIIGPTAYVIGDDSPFIYLLDAATLAPLARVLLFESADFGTGRLPKAIKPDLECMVALTWPDGVAGVLALGSGSTTQRETGWFVPVTGTPPRRVDLAGLYQELRAHLPAGVQPLNLEAAATSATELLLFQRTVGQTNAALVFILPLAETLKFLTGDGPVPAVRQQLFQLPDIEGSPAGFSGATFVNDRLFVTASVENTSDAVLDGEVLGSFVGVVNLATQAAQLVRLAWADGRIYKGKVEGLAVRRQLAPSRWELLLVTDDDAGGSTAVVAELAW